MVCPEWHYVRRAKGFAGCLKIQDIAGSPLDAQGIGVGHGESIATGTAVDRGETISDPFTGFNTTRSNNAVLNWRSSSRLLPFSWIAKRK